MVTAEMINIILDIRKEFVKKKKLPIHIIVSGNEIIIARSTKEFSIEDMDKTLGLLVDTAYDAFITKNPHSTWDNLICDPKKHIIYHFLVEGEEGYIELAMVKDCERKVTDPTKIISGA